MTNAEERVYFGRSSIQVASQLIVFWDEETAARIAKHQIRALAFRVEHSNAALIVFWASVLHHTDKLLLPNEEKTRIFQAISPAKRAAFRSLELRSRPQIVTRKAP